MALSEKQKDWLYYFLPPAGRFNATDAGRRAGYSWPNKAGPRVSHSPKLRPYLQDYFRKRDAAAVERMAQMKGPERAEDLRRTLLIHGAKW